MRVLVLGGSGMLGHKIVQCLAAECGDLWWTLHGGADDCTLDPVPMLRGEHAITDVDARDLNAIARLLDSMRPDWVVNCIGIVKQRDAASEAVPSIQINSLLPHFLAERVAELEGRLIHFSTDCVFSGRRGRYTEDEMPDPVDLYGRTKALGEVITPRAITLRTSIIGRELRNDSSLLAWFLAQNGERVRGYTEAWWSGFTTVELAKVVLLILRDHPDLNGLFQLSAGRISKFDLLRRLRIAYDLDIEIEPDATFACDRSLVPGRFSAVTGYRAPTYDEMIRDLVADPTPYPEFKK